MASIERVWLAVLTKNAKDAGTTAGKLNLTVNVDGVDVADVDFAVMPSRGGTRNREVPQSAWLDVGQAALIEQKGQLDRPFDSAALTNSSCRLALRGEDPWAPLHVMVLGESKGRVFPIAMEMDIDAKLTAGLVGGKQSIPLRLVGAGTDATKIKRVALLTYTGGGADSGTDSPVVLQITAGGNIVLKDQIPDTPQDDLEELTGNMYFFESATPFTKAQLAENGGLRLSILEAEPWLPKCVFLFGFDTASGRPNTAVTLASVTKWTLGSLSADPQKGKSAIDLPLA